MKSNKKQLIILAQSLEQPRIVKRIIEQSLVYEKIVVYGFKREIHAVNNFGILKNYKNIEVIIVGNLINEQYTTRLLIYFKLLLKILLRHGVRKKNIYVFGLDLRIISTLILNKKITYEISDITWLYQSGMQRKILSKIDKSLSGKSNKVVFTSQGFYDIYYKDNVLIENIIIKENKFKSYDKVFPIKQLKLDKIRIGYIGAFRYAQIVNHLLAVVKENPNLLLNFYGDGHDKKQVLLMKTAAKEFENITYNGSFKNPDDLGKIYAENNLNFVVYDNSLANERVAMPNKYYESGFFNIPIVCAKETYVGKRVIETKIGWEIETNKNAIDHFLNNLTLKKLTDCHNEIKKIDKSLFSLQ